MPTGEDTKVAASYSKNLTLDIGGRKFKASRDTLKAESGLFRRQLSDSFTWEPEADGSFFLDADPDLFEHQIRFMRRPEVFPLFYDAAKGFDYDLYNRLQAESEYFQVDALNRWIKTKKYIQAVQVSIRPNRDARELEDLPLREMLTANCSQDYHMITVPEKVFVCPRGYGSHRDAPEKCGRGCKRAQGDDPDQYEDDVDVRVVTVRKETNFTEAVCRVE